MRTTLIVLGALLSAFLVFRWDYYLSQYLFEQVCSDSDLIGLHVYERDYVDRQYTTVQVVENGYPMTSRNEYYYEDNIALLKDHIDNRFDYKRSELVELYSVGPIVILQTTLTRKSDGKLLAKAVTAQSMQGWLNRFFSSGYHRSFCPTNEVEPGEILSDADKNHLFLLRDTLIVN